MKRFLLRDVFGSLFGGSAPAASEANLDGIEIVGESAFQGNFERIVGRRTPDGFDRLVEARFAPSLGDRPDGVAVAVFVGRFQVGLLLGESARRYRAALGDRISSAPARIVGGWYRDEFDNGYFGIRIEP